MISSCHCCYPKFKTCSTILLSERCVSFMQEGKRFHEELTVLCVLFSLFIQIFLRDIGNHTVLKCNLFSADPVVYLLSSPHMLKCLF